MNYQIKSWIGGMNSDVAGSLIRGDQYVRGVNVSSRGGSARTRPFLRDLGVSLATGKFQGSSVYSLDAADRLVIAIAGSVYTYNLETEALTDTGISLDATVDNYWFCQAEQYFVIQDGVNRPWILNYNGNDPDVGTQAARAIDGGGAVNEVPIGTAMAYGHGRLAVALRELGGSSVTERFFAVGDIMLPTSPETVLQFTETDYLAEGGAFALPNELGLIHGMAYLKNQQSGNGLGSLIVFARNGASAFKINAPRGQWKNIDISDVLFTSGNMGTFAEKSIIAINNDLVYRSLDGLRTVGYNIAKQQGGSAVPSNDTVSRLVDKELSEDSQSSMKYCYAAQNDNRIYFLTQDTTVNGEHAYKSMIVMDTAALSNYGRTTTPEFDGLWTGLNFQSVLTARADGFYVTYVNAKESDGSNKIYYIDTGAATYQDGGTSSPVCRIYMGGVDISAGSDKENVIDNRRIAKFEYAELWASDIIGTTSFTLYWRPYGHELWLPCPTGTVCFNDTGKPGFTHGMRFVPGTDTVGDNIEVNFNMSKIFEFCLEWTGRARIDAIVFELSPQDLGINASCDNDGTCVTITDGEDGDELDDFAYSIA